MDLEPITPEAAVELYLKDKKQTAAKATINSHRSRLGFFVDWCENSGITNLNNLTGRKLYRYRIWRRDIGDLAIASLKTQMDTLRVFVKFLESIDGVDMDLHQKIRSPTLNQGENNRNVRVHADDAEAILAYLKLYHYASRRHVILMLLWRTMMRSGALRGLDVSDYNATEQSLQVRHRAETGTPLKNQEQGERHIAIGDDTCVVLDDWLRDRRPPVTDDYGRDPLITTRQGRVSSASVRTYCYRMTRPCKYGRECPHDRDPQECEAAGSETASRCPSSLSAHPFRRGAITHNLRNDIPEKVLSGRANVTEDILDRHYDQRTSKQKMEQRREYLDAV